MAELRDLPRHVLARLRAASQRRRCVQIGAGVRFGPGVRCYAVPGARVVIGDRVEIGARTSLAAIAKGAELSVGGDVFIAGDCIIAAADRIEIGRDSMIAELVSVRDHDHDPQYPPREGRSICAPVTIGERVWIGAKASVLRGASIGSDSVVGAHALVNSEIPPNCLAVGLPATVRRTNIKRPMTEPGLLKRKTS